MRAKTTAQLQRTELADKRRQALEIAQRYASDAAEGRKLADWIIAFMARSPDHWMAIQAASFAQGIYGPDSFRERAEDYARWLFKKPGRARRG